MNLNLLSSSRNVKIIISFFIIALLIVFYKPIFNYFTQFLFQYPTIASMYSQVQIEWLTRSLKGLFLMSFFGTLFFISVPTELVFIQYVNTSTPIIIVICVALLANILAMLINYIFGFILGRTLLKMWLKEKFDLYQDRIQYWGSIILFVGNVLPSPIELVALVYGASRFPLVKYIYIVLIARLVRYLLLLYLISLFPDFISRLTL